METGPADSARGLEVDEVERLAKLDVILAVKSKDAGGAEFAEFAAVGLR